MRKEEGVDQQTWVYSLHSEALQPAEKVYAPACQSTHCRCKSTLPLAAKYLCGETQMESQ